MQWIMNSLSGENAYLFIVEDFEVLLSSKRALFMLVFQNADCLR